MCIILKNINRIEDAADSISSLLMRSIKINVILTRNLWRGLYPVCRVGDTNMEKELLECA